jgi:hypothetical protein
MSSILPCRMTNVLPWRNVPKLCVRPKNEFADFILAERQPDQLFRHLRRQA